MDFRKLEQLNKEFLDSLNLDKYIEKERDVEKIIYAIENDYDDSPELPNELDGCVFNYLGIEDIAWYLADRYGLGCYESMIYRYTLYNK